MIQASFMVNTANDAPSALTLHSPAKGSSLDTLNPLLSIYNVIVHVTGRLGAIGFEGFDIIRVIH